MQVLNVACGGTLRQDLGAGHQPDGSRFGETAVRMDGAELPGSLLGPTATVACYPHQAVDRLGSGLVATGWSGDGTVESLRHAGREFVLGLQWHPEVRPESRVFEAFAAAGRRRC
jgi:gamma-glutamyl-gamma-aminobutyrate hydrolase PuuD